MSENWVTGKGVAVVGEIVILANGDRYKVASKGSLALRWSPNLCGWIKGSRTNAEIAKLIAKGPKKLI